MLADNHRAPAHYWICGRGLIECHLQCSRWDMSFPVTSDDYHLHHWLWRYITCLLVSAHAAALILWSHAHNWDKTFVALSASTNVAFSAYLGRNDSMLCFCMFSAFLLSPSPYTHYSEPYFTRQRLMLACIGSLGYSTMDLHRVPFTYTLVVGGLDSLRMEATGSVVAVDWMWGAVVEFCRGCNQILYDIIKSMTATEI
jgi:hypothetical protein